jgi:predicted NAD-dependent protein-ADP-ribosyltransferase YbiA (DUF1768 family)
MPKRGRPLDHESETRKCDARFNELFNVNTDQPFYSAGRCNVGYNMHVTPALSRDRIREFEAFSNFYPCPHGVNIDNVTYATSEHAFQALRWMVPLSDDTKDTSALRKEYVERIAFASTPSQAFFLHKFVEFTKKGELSNSAPMPDHVFRPLREYMNEMYNKGLRKFPPNPIRDWTIMVRCVGAKFQQNPELMSILKSTGTKRIVEHTTRDAVWGDNGDGTGLNQLGECLMSIRDES